MDDPSHSSPSRRVRNSRGEGARLGDDIVTAALDILTDLKAGETFSLRAVAIRTGIAAPSIYRHFPDKDRLIATVMARLFEELAALRDAAERQVAAEGGDAWDRLLARSLAYARFGVERGGHYRLLYEDAATTQFSDPTISACGAAMTHRSEELILAMLPMDRPDHAGIAKQMATGLWAGLHGIVSLRLHRPALHWSPLEEAVRQMQEALIARSLRNCTGNHSYPP